MAKTNVTIEIDVTLKEQLQELLSNLGMDMTTFFTMAAKTAVREQTLPFKPNMDAGMYGIQAYKLAMKNTKYNKDGEATISSGDEWNDEVEWDDIFQQITCASQKQEINMRKEYDIASLNPRKNIYAEKKDQAVMNIDERVKKNSQKVRTTDTVRLGHLDEI